MKPFALLYLCFSLLFSVSLLGSVAPVTIAPIITMSASGPISIPITVNNFNDIGALTLSLEYDPSIITYQNTYTKNPAFSSFFDVGDNAGTGTRRRIVIVWFGFSSVNLINGSTLCTLNFTYSTANGTSTELTWYDNITSCEYTDGSGNILLDTPTADYYKNGVVSPPLLANFSANSLTPPKSATVAFTDLSTGGPTSWSWGFNRTSVVFVNGTSSSSQNPKVQFTDGGLYTVTLVVHNTYLANTVVKTDYIRAGTAGKWTGITSTDWSTASNWDDYLLPAGTTDVIIPASAPNWPVFYGNLTLGVNCRNLTLSGSASRMTVTGNLTLP